MPKFPLKINSQYQIIASLNNNYKLFLVIENGG